MNVFVVETSSIPPGPRGYWVLGNLPDFAGDLLGFLTRCARDYGDIVRLRLGTSPAVLLNRPNQIEQVLVTRQAEFVKYRFFWRHVTRVFGNGLLTSAGSLWQRQHALMAPAFRQERLALSVDKMVCCANRLFDRWQDGEERDIRADMTRLTLEIAAKVLFDVELDRAVAGISRAVDRGMEEVSKRFKRGMFIPDWIPPLSGDCPRSRCGRGEHTRGATGSLSGSDGPALDVAAKSGCRGASNGRPAAS